MTSSIVPSRRFWLLFALGLPIALAGAAVPGFERLVIPYDVALLVILVVSGKTAANWNALSVKRRFEPVLSVRHANSVTIEVESSAPVALDILIRDEVPESCQAEGNEFRLKLPAGGNGTKVYTVVPETRGPDEFRGTFLRFLAPLGLAIVQTRLETRTPVTVYPNVHAVRDYELLKQKGRLKEAGLRRSHVRGLGTEFESLREYNDDDFRFIDWKSTARRGRLVVRNYEQERNQSVIVCVDLGRHMLGEVGGITKLDHALDAALLLFHSAERAGDLVGLYAFNDSVQAYVAPKRGRAQVAAVLKASHALRAEAVQPNYVKAFTYLSSKWKRRSLVVVFTDAENEDQAAELAEALGHIRRNHLLMVVRVKDPRLKELLALDVVDDRSLSQRAAATWYQSDRVKAARVLAAAGIATVEAEPQDLPSALVSAYLRVKDRALL